LSTLQGGKAWISKPMSIPKIQKTFIDASFWGIHVGFVLSIVYQHCKVEGMDIKTYINSQKTYINILC
jgi:uncharacterized membrane-anchored protein YitT (DUF2179 family)